VSEWSDMSTRELLFQWVSTIKNTAERVALVQNESNSLKINLFSPWYNHEIAELALTTNHSLTH
jgi:hypothetical protein